MECFCYLHLHFELYLHLHNASHCITQFAIITAAQLGSYFLIQTFLDARRHYDIN